MNRYAVDVDGRRQRASATLEGPASPPSPPSPPRKGARPGERVVSGPSPSHATTLREQQRAFARAVMERGAVADREVGRIEDLLTAGPRLSALERLDIYRRGYGARLVECLADDYPVLQHALGDGPFEDLCRAYIAAHPTRGPSLNFFGRHMACF